MNLAFLDSRKRHNYVWNSTENREMSFSKKCPISNACESVQKEPSRPETQPQTCWAWKRELLWQIIQQHRITTRKSRHSHFHTSAGWRDGGPAESRKQLHVGLGSKPEDNPNLKLILSPAWRQSRWWLFFCVSRQMKKVLLLFEWDRFNLQIKTAW